MKNFPSTFNLFNQLLLKITHQSLFADDFFQNNECSCMHFYFDWEILFHIPPYIRVFLFRVNLHLLIFLDQFLSFNTFSFSPNTKHNVKNGTEVPRANPMWSQKEFYCLNSVDGQLYIFDYDLCALVSPIQIFNITSEYIYKF